jgi:hypothetical protein
LQVDHAAGGGGESAIHAFEFSTAQPANCELDHGGNRYKKNEPAKV